MLVVVSFAALAGVILFHYLAQRLARRLLPRTRRGEAIAILLGTPAQYLLAVALILPVALMTGLERPDRMQVVQVQEGAPADGVLRPGDVLLGSAASIQVQARAGDPFELGVIRDGETSVVRLIPRDGRIGIQMMPGKEKLSTGAALVHSAVAPARSAEQIVDGLVMVASGRAEAQIVGPVGMVRVISAQAGAGWVRALQFLATLTVYVGLLWVVADLARLFFLFRRKRVRSPS